MSTSVLDTMSYRAGEIILYPGVPGPKDQLYRVRSGLVRLQSVDEEGNALTLRFVRPGEFFGEEVLSGTERAYFAEAATDTRIDALSPALLTSEETQQLTVHLVMALAQTYKTIQRLTGQRLKNRIAAALLELSQTPAAFKEPGGRMGVRATHDEIASAVGSVRETVTKVIGELSREGYIRSGYGKLVLQDLEGLEDLAGQAA
ncbi:MULTISPECIES: helix-turn-helix domain-containing protein [unclassified Meiothermus]|uniref:helix-turn-helix domain-containing protein n=1 Tax=unclassified Meiothermus TaxID=370471 RepID=UPI000D7C5AD9|nr:MULTISPECIES: helix-turn-helix domain-containing protein [unclassified Meiothermus]PZA06446.1 Crp/Fnr family transcriptional regulator [Meiothermus sp. Pnk-1]RYM36287.1 cyclic nucleotide-binding domain-containing protein [Meiothermus sp. PNK-Is4]